MVPHADLVLGAALRDLRRSRRFSLHEASRRLGVSKAALAAWENGTRRPRGPALARLLNLLEADRGTKTRILHLADPQQAKFVLADSPLGGPVNMGTVLRAMRLRRGFSQTDLARRVGVSQAAVSKWENGDTVPSRETLHDVGFALGATVEETLALASVTGGGDAAFADDPEVVRERVWDRGAPGPLREVLLLAWEAELRRRAARDAKWDVSLVALLAARANLLVYEERHEEIVPIARRALRLASTPEAWTEAIPALAALADADRFLGRGASGHLEAAQRADAWSVALPDSMLKSWALRQAGMSLIRLGSPGGGVERVARSARMDLDLASEHPAPWSHRATILGDAYLEAGEPRRAAALLDGRRDRHLAPTLFIAVEHANDRAATDAEMAYLRFWTATYAATPLGRRRLARIERRQATLRHASRGPEDAAIPEDPIPGDPHAETRLWTAVLRESRG